MNKALYILGVLLPVVVLSCKEKEPELPEIEISCTTISADGIGETSATIRGSALVTGVSSGSVETCFYLGADIGSLKTTGKVISGGFVSGQGGSFSAVAEDLEPGTKYYYAASAFFNGTTAYGDVVSFETKQREIVKTLGVSEITYDSAVLSGYADLDHAGTNEFGMLISKSENPTLDNSAKWTAKEIDKDNAFTVKAIDLNHSTTYYYRAFVGSTPMRLGEVLSFSTPVYIEVESITLTPESMELVEGDECPVVATVLPENATDKTVTWTSSNPSVATVDENGKIHGITIGTAVITAKAGNVSATCSLSVIPEVPVTSIVLSPSLITLKEGDAKTITATVTPYNATYKTIKWSSSDASVATVDQDGTVHGVSEGSTKITAEVGSVKSTSCSVTVVPYSPNISFADQRVKSILLQYGHDKDGDKEISMYEAAAIHDLYGFSHTDIESFDELEYFTGLVSLRLTFNECEQLKSVKIPQTVKTLDNTFERCTSLTSVIIPDSVIEITYGTFAHCQSLTSVVVPSSVTSMGNFCFRDCPNLKQIVLPDSITSLGGWFFEGCTGLTSVKLPNRITTLGKSSFEECSALESIVLPDSITEIGERCFYGCASLSSVTLSNNLTSLPKTCFTSCSAIQSIIVPDSVTQIDEYCFSGCTSLSTINLSNSLTSIGSGCFAVCSALVSIVIPDLVTQMGDSCFSGCANLSSITLSKTLSSLSKYCFNNCVELASITVPSSVKSIGESCFQYAMKLSSATFLSDTPPVVESWLFMSPYIPIIYVPTASVEAYKSAEKWSRYADYIKPIQE